ncbi:MAG: amidase [Alphaproteobacteria bacterium]|nr:amidase [Alphaproteobacteria bacterium]
MGSRTQAGSAPDICFLTIAEAARLIKARKLSPVELAEASIRRIEGVEPQLNAFVTPTLDLARKQARKAEREITAGSYRGPMHGIPFGLKDIYNTAGIRTTGHSKISMTDVPKTDAATTARLLAAGGVLMGKLSTDEFAHGGPSFDLPWPPARNPWNPHHTASGSSSGSGAAVAAGMVPGTMGSDTGGSIRLPSSQNGVVGLKPTYGLISRAGVIPNSFTFDYCGPLAWTVEDCAIMLQVLAGFDPADPGSADRAVPNYRAALKPYLKGMRIGVVRHFWEEEFRSSDDTQAAMAASLDVLKKLGAKLEDVRLRSRQEYFDVKFIIAESEIFSIHQKDLIERVADFGADFIGKISLAALFQSGDYVQAQRKRRRMLEEIKPLYRKYDALITAGPDAAIRFDQHRITAFWEKPNITTPFNVLGGPAMTVCNGFSRDGLPLSLQIIGRPFDDATVLRVGHAYEKATPWRDRRPSLVEGAAPVTVTQWPYEPPTPEPAMRQKVEMLAARAGLKLTDKQLFQLCDEARHGFDMVERIRRDQDRWDYPANNFDFRIWSERSAGTATSKPRRKPTHKRGRKP